MARTKPFGYEFARDDSKPKIIYQVRLHEEDIEKFEDYKKKMGIKEDSTAFRIAFKYDYARVCVLQNPNPDIEVTHSLKRKWSEKAKNKPKGR